MHINLTVGKPIIENTNITDVKGVFYYNKEQIEKPKLTYQDAYNEIMAKIDVISNYSYGKLKLHHLDTHHHLMENHNIRQDIIDISKKFNLPIRKENAQNIKCSYVLYKEFIISNVNVESIRYMVEIYNEKIVVVELMTHLGFKDKYTKSVTSYLNRESELNILKESKKIGLFKEVELINYQQI